MFGVVQQQGRSCDGRAAEAIRDHRPFERRLEAMIARRAGLGPDRLVQGAEFVIIEIIGLLEAAAHLRLDAEPAPEARLRNIPVMRHGTACEGSAERRVGDEWGRTCRCRWAPETYK